MPLHGTTAIAVAARLRDDINSGRWLPGSKLVQEDLAAEYRVSRIPVREALNLLRAEGLVVIEPNRGAFVISLSAEEVEEIFELRIMLESRTLRLATPKHTKKTLAKLEAIQAELEAADERTAWIEGDRAFHDALYLPSGRTRTVELIRLLRAPVERYGLANLTPSTRRREWAKEHRRIISAVSEGDHRKAVEVLVEHLAETQKLVSRIITQ